METVYIQIRAPRGKDPGKLLKGHYNVIDNTVFLVDPTGKPIKADDRQYSRKFTPGENPKQIAAQMLRVHHNTTQAGTPRGFNDKLNYPKVRF